MKILSTLACLLAALSFSAVIAEEKKGEKTYPKMILIIRHAEKPPDEEKSVHLSEEGKKRANALPKLFDPSSKLPAHFPKPDFIFATHNSEHSHRPLETVTPLADKIGLTIQREFKNKPEGIQGLKAELLGNKAYEGKVVLICWHHGTMAELASALGAEGARTPDSKVFDRIWRLTYGRKGKVDFANLSQRLMPGDSKE